MRASGYCKLVLAKPIIGYLIIFSLAAIPIAVGQDSGVAPKIFADNSESVFLITVRSDSGDVVGEATGFIIKDGKILTNKHVVDEGSVYVHFGPVRLPAIVEKTDLINDLALLKVEGDLTFKPLTLSAVTLDPGTNIYAIGNPAGLERSISTGVVAGSRVMEGRQLLQITSPISPGSSGGPVFNAKGEVVGIAVGMLEGGQNLNFAIPASVVLKWLHGEPDEVEDVDLILSKVDALVTEMMSDEVEINSDRYQQLQIDIDKQLAAALNKAGDDCNLLIGVSSKALIWNNDISLSAAEKAVGLKPSKDSHLALARVLQWKSYGNDADKEKFLEAAEKSIRSAMSFTKQPTAEMYSVLASILENRGSIDGSNAHFKKAITLSKTEDDEVYYASVRGIIRTAEKLNNETERDSYFGLLSKAGKATWFDWRTQASRKASKGDYLAAGHAYWKAAEFEMDWKDYCTASAYLYGLEGTSDNVLMLARKCIDLGAGKEDSDEAIADAHDSIAGILCARGVYSEAEKNARMATTLDPSNAHAFHRLSLAFSGMGKRQEAINAARQAIRLSDGKYADMHFQLGSAYFDVEDWVSSQQSFEMAAQLDPKGEAAPYNVALCLSKLRYYQDAANWFEESLRRNPNQSNRNDILRKIQVLRK